MRKIRGESLALLLTTTEVMRVLGGTKAVSSLIASPYKATENWNRAATFPSRYFFLMTHELRRRGFSAPPELWGQVMPADRSAPTTAKRRAA